MISCQGGSPCWDSRIVRVSGPLLRSEGEYMRSSECPDRAMIDVVDGKWKPMIINY